MTVTGWLVIAAILIALGWLCYRSPVVLLGIASIMTITLVVGILNGQRLRRLAEERNGESICEFARSFDRRVADPWVIRAVYESLQPYLLGRDTTFGMK